ncbi:amidotransferase 1, exosortase A system-associated [soil metagenome]
MCGIAGIWGGGESPQAAGGRVSAMLQRMRHRGPDGEGGFAFESGAAGMVRLSLVDLSDRGQQPLWSADRKVALLFNGEIYNFREHRKRLLDKGYPFQSKTDSEVILALYLEHGEDFVHHLRGMYAIALFDWRRSRPGGVPELLLVRGPLGIKPMYVATTGPGGNGCVFASELRGLMASRLVDPVVSQDALHDYLNYGFVIQPRTFIQGVRMLEPGVLERHSPGLPIKTHRFWSMPAYEPRKESFEEAAERLRHELEESIALHTFADAKVGAFLSGGVDSNGIVGLMCKHLPGLQTYTLRYPEFPASDESQAARESAAHFGCANTTVDVLGSEVRDILPRFAGDLDQPSTDGLNTWMVCRAAARDVKGVLSGLGGDEWFSGYPYAQRMLYHGTTSRGRTITEMGKWANRLGRFLPQSHSPGRVQGWLEKLGSRRNLLAIWMQPHTVFGAVQTENLMADPGGVSQVNSIMSLFGEAAGDLREESPLGMCMQLDVAAFMRCQLLRDSDATSMAHSLELRVPFVDINLARFSRTCDDNYKMDLNLPGGQQSKESRGKRVLLRALRDVIPTEIQNRQKRGFELPLHQWALGDCREIVQDSCSPSTVKARGLLDPAAVSGLLAAAEQKPSLYFPKAWSLMILELWCQEILDHVSSTGDLMVNERSLSVRSNAHLDRSAVPHMFDRAGITH